MKPFTVIAIVIFALVSLLHLLRYFLGWGIVIHTVSVPMWVSLVGFVIAGGLLFLGNCSRRYSRSPFQTRLYRLLPCNRTTYIHVGVLWREMK